MYLHIVKLRSSKRSSTIKSFHVSISLKSIWNLQQNLMTQFFFGFVLFFSQMLNQAFFSLSPSQSFWINTTFELHSTGDHLKWQLETVEKWSKTYEIPLPVNAEVTAAAAIRYALDCICVPAPIKRNRQHLGYVWPHLRLVHVTVTLLCYWFDRTTTTINNKSVLLLFFLRQFSLFFCFFFADTMTMIYEQFATDLKQCM